MILVPAECLNGLDKSVVYYELGSGGSELSVCQRPEREVPAKGVPMTKELKTSAEGRRCKFPDCHHLLSIYNHQTYCRVHQEQAAAKEKNKPYRHICK